MEKKTARTQRKVAWADRVASTFDDPQYSDLRITCGPRTWNVHHIIVCTKCKFFEKACDGRFQESETKEITLEEDHPLAVEAMLTFIYTTDYKDTIGGDEVPALILNNLVHAISDKHDIKDLGERACAKFDKCAQEQWNQKVFAEAFRQVRRVSHWDPSLKEVANKVVLQHGREVFTTDKGRFIREVVDTEPGLGVSLCAGLISYYDIGDH